MDQKEYTSFIINRCRAANYSGLPYHYSVPELLRRTPLPPIATEILQCRSLMTKVLGTEFFLSDTIKDCFIRRDYEINSNADYTFWSDVFRHISLRFDIYPLIATPKQKHQIWDKSIVHSAFAYIENCHKNLSPRVNKIVHDFAPNITINEIIKINEINIENL